MRINRNEIIIVSIKLTTVSSHLRKEKKSTLKKNDATDYNMAYNIDIKYELTGYQPADYTHKACETWQVSNSLLSLKHFS